VSIQPPDLVGQCLGLLANIVEQIVVVGRVATG
jgi:hypothetical protein